MARDADLYASRLAELSSDPAFARLIQSAGFDRDPETGRFVLITADRARRLVRAGVEWLEGFLADVFLVLAFLPFMLLGGSPVAVRAGGLPEEVAVRVRRYLVEMFAFSVLTGVLVGGILALLGVRFWLSFGFLAFVLNFIPTLGSIVATVLPVPVVLIDPDMAGGAKLLAILLPALVQVVVGNIIQPRFQSRTQGVHPVAAILALIVFGMLWGPVGTVLAVPLAAVLKIAFERIPGGGPFATLLAGRLHGNVAAPGSVEKA
jgi:AI-2 transport protein TqsA